VRIWDVKTGQQFGVCPGSQSVLPPIPTAEGVYLRGRGVVFTLALAPAAAQPAQPPKGSHGKPLSEWELMRKHLRGEDVKQTAQPAPKHPDLAEALLKLLADNGHNFTGLAPQESLTVAVTFRPVIGKPGMGGARAFSPAFDFDGDGIVPLILTDGSASLQGGTGKKAETKDQSTSRDLELLADLQLKQGKSEEAIKLLLKAVELNPGPVHQIVLYRKLAKAFLALEEQARDATQRDLAVQKALHYLKQVQDAEAAQTKPPQPAAKATPLPSRLLVSATKQQLDAVAAGKLTFDEFRLVAQVQWLHFPEAEGKTKPKGP
jgi:hypothetical protein